MSDSTSPWWPPLAPAALFKAWEDAFRFAPRSLNQPILPGWTFVNNFNSTAPQTEADVVAVHSYGRQLGRISDVLELLIAERAPGARSAKAFTAFLDMKREIDDVKRRAAVERVEQIVRDLATLRVQNKAEYERLSAALRDVLK